jgi:preprotein translocase subunit SecD
MTIAERRAAERRAAASVDGDDGSPTADAAGDENEEKH